MPTITQLPLDIEGNSPTNLRENESHDIVAARGKKNRVIVPDFGAFFIDDAEVRDADGVALVRHKNLEFTYHYELFSELSGKGVCALMVITDPTLRAPFTITYRAVGGNFSLSVRELKDVLDYIEENPEKVKWDDIVDKPTAYVPEKHMNKYWQLIGLDTLVTNLNRLGDSIRVGRKTIIDASRTYYEGYAEEMRRLLEDYRARIYAHIEDVSNPHQSDKSKIGLGNLNNWPLANFIQSIDPSVRDKYQPIGGIYNQLIQESIPVLEAHIKDKAAVGKPDPHNVTLAQLNLYSGVEIEVIFNRRLKRGEPAYNTNQLVGIDWPTMYSNFRKDLTTENIAANTRFTMNHLGRYDGQYPVTEYALTGANNFVRYVDLMKTFNDTAGTIVPIGSYGSASAAQNAANAAIASKQLTNGTWIIANYSKAYYDVRLYSPVVFLVVNGAAATKIV